VATIEFGLAGEKPKRKDVPEFTPLVQHQSVVVYMGQTNEDEAAFPGVIRRDALRRRALLPGREDLLDAVPEGR
jgi:hypothetical protein